MRPPNQGGDREGHLLGRGAAATALRIANIGLGERRKRRFFGHVALGISIALGAALITGRVGQPWRLALFVPVFVAALGYFQDRDRT